MNLHEAFDQAAPPMSTDGLAAGVRRRRLARRRAAAGAGVASLAVIAVAFGASTIARGPSALPSTAATSDAVLERAATEDATAHEAPDLQAGFAPGTLVAGHLTLLQRDETSPVMLCHEVAASDPPQCRGPIVVGEIDWEALDAEARAGSGQRDAFAWVVGRFDNATGTLTLAVTPTLDRPAGAREPDAEQAVPGAAGQGDLVGAEGAVRERLDDSLVSAHADVAAGVLRVRAFAADTELVARIHEATDPYVARDHVEISSLLTPIGK